MSEKKSLRIIKKDECIQDKNGDFICNIRNRQNQYHLKRCKRDQDISAEERDDDWREKYARNETEFES